MKISNFNRKIFFDILQKFSKIYNEYKIDKDLYLRIIYYYFLSTKQIYHIYKQMNYEIKNDKAYLQNKFDDFLNFQNENPESFLIIKEKIFKETSFFFEIDYLHLNLINYKKNDINIEKFLTNVIQTINDTLTISISGFDANKTFVEPEHLLDFASNIFNVLNFDLLIEIKNYINSDVSNEGEIFSDLFDYLTLFLSSQIEIDIPYIPDFITNFLINSTSEKDQISPNSVALIGKTNFSFIKILLNKFNLKNLYFDGSLYSNQEYDFLDFASSLSDEYRNNSFGVSLVEFNKKYDLVFGLDLSTNQSYNDLVLNFVDSGKFGKRVYSGYKSILKLINILNSNQIGAIVMAAEVLDSKSTSSKKIKEFLIKNNYIKSIISLPNSIIEKQPTKLCVVFIENNIVKTKENIFMYNAYLDFKKTKSDKLRYMDDVHVNNLSSWIKKSSLNDNYSKLITKEDIIKKEWSLVPDKYIKIKQTNKSELSIKKMLEEISKEKANMKELTKKISNKNDN